MYGCGEVGNIDVWRMMAMGMEAKDFEGFSWICVAGFVLCKGILK